MWFIIHEFSENKPQKIINYFEKIHKKFPNSKILLGEIVKPDKKILEKNIYNSILPEYIFFHEMSGQGILTYNELKFILKKIPYKLKKQINIDVISYKNKKNPSGIIWILEPR